VWREKKEAAVRGGGRGCKRGQDEERRQGKRQSCKSEM
jgi:hypothetical protein